MSLLKFNEPYVVRINEQMVEFPKIFLGDYNSLWSHLKFIRKERIQSAVKDGIFTAEEGLILLKDLIATKNIIWEVQRACNDHEFVMKVIEKSWAKTGKPLSEIVDILKEHDPVVISEIAFTITQPLVGNDEFDKKKATITPV